MTRTVQRGAAASTRGSGGLMALLLAIGISLPGSGAAAPDLCHRAAARAAEATGVPLPVLTAIALTETGRRVDGRMAPWPWAINVAGASHYPDTLDSALDLARDVRRSGRRNFDLGCFQINYRWHGEAFDSLAQMLDPAANALYAARFLARLHADLGDWSLAAGRYHSATPVHANRYRDRFDTYLAAVEARPAPSPTGPTAFLGGGGGARSPGSLMPLGGAGQPFLTGASGPFWGDG